MTPSLKQLSPQTFSLKETTFSSSPDFLDKVMILKELADTTWPETLNPTLTAFYQNALEHRDHRVVIAALESLAEGKERSTPLVPIIFDMASLPSERIAEHCFKALSEIGFNADDVANGYFRAIDRNHIKRAAQMLELLPDALEPSTLLPEIVRDAFYSGYIELVIKAASALKHFPAHKKVLGIELLDYLDKFEGDIKLQLPIVEVLDAWKISFAPDENLDYYLKTFGDESQFDVEYTPPPPPQNVHEALEMLRGDYSECAPCLSFLASNHISDMRVLKELIKLVQQEDLNLAELALPAIYNYGQRGEEARPAILKLQKNIMDNDIYNPSLQASIQETLAVITFPSLKENSKTSSEE